MSGFTKTVIVDSSLQPPFPPMSYNTIKAAVDAITTAGGGTVYVEQGLYEISDANTDTVTLPSNISVIGSAGAIVKVTKDVVAFQANNEERIYISGLKFVVDCKNNQDQYVEYAQHLIYFRGVKNSVVEKLYFECTSPKGISSNAAAICFNGANATCAA